MSFSKSIPAGNTSPRHIVALDSAISPCAKSQKSQTHLSPAERTAKILAFRGAAYNFTQGMKPTPSKPVNYSIGANRTI